MHEKLESEIARSASSSCESPLLPFLSLSDLPRPPNFWRESFQEDTLPARLSSPLLSSPLKICPALLSSSAPTSSATTAPLSRRQLLQRQPLLSLLSLGEALLSVLSSQLKLESRLPSGSCEVEAVADATKAIQLDPSMSKAYFRKGTACMKLEEYQTAKAALEAGAALVPGDNIFTKLIKECDERIAEEEMEIPPVYSLVWQDTKFHVLIILSSSFIKGLS
ncbi:protein SGT1 isoform X2 [Carex littledalei]|uniref:Protein SGT1 isoform X2 n=1 Tax=Carex littledalei TaxID=544730 RepID=A0A833R2R2_9POAL|nr:protein SGT1 isoform X2 [Carex littledalei]